MSKRPCVLMWRISRPSRRRSSRTGARGPSVRSSFRACRGSAKQATIRSANTWAACWPALPLGCLSGTRRQTRRRITSSWNAGSDSPKGTSAAYTATSTVGSASSTKAPRCSWPSMRTWRTRNRSRRRSYGPSATARLQRVNGRPCSAVRLCAGLAPRKNAPCYWLNSNTAIWRAPSFLSARCNFFHPHEIADGLNDSFSLGNVAVDNRFRAQRHHTKVEQLVTFTFLLEPHDFDGMRADIDTYQKLSAHRKHKRGPFFGVRIYCINVTKTSNFFLKNCAAF